MIPLYCLPGLMCTAEVFDALARETPDALRRIELPQGDDFAKLAQDIAAQIDRDCVLCGMSMGAYLAIAVARQRPDRVRGVVLIGGTAQADSEQAAENRGKTAAWARRKGIAALSAAQADTLLGRAQREDADLRATLLRMAEAVGLDTFAAHQQALAERPDLTDALAGLPCPVLSITGAEDVVNPPDAGRRMADVARQGTYHEIQGAGHLPVLEAPQAVAEMIGDFRQAITQENTTT